MTMLAVRVDVRCKLMSPRWLVFVLVCVLVLLRPSHSAQAQSTAGILAVAGRINSNPTVAASGQFEAVVWSAATTNAMDIYAAVSRDGGASFGAPVQVNAIPGEARVSGEEPPRVVLVPRAGSVPDVVVVWTAKNGAATRILSARSNDGGRTFSIAMPVPGSEGDGARGWQSLAVDSTGRVLVLWLDHRETVMMGARHTHDASAPAAKADPTERAGLSQLYFSSLDGTDAVTITRSVCYCCKTTLMTSGRNVYAVWRHVYPGSQRDIAFSMSRDRGKTFLAPVRVSDDHWQIDGCPDNGPSMAIDATQRVHVAWPTPADGKDMTSMALFYAVSRDGATFTPRVRVPTRGAASHAQLVMNRDGSSLLAWDEVVDGTRRLGMVRVVVNATGKTTFTALPAPDAGPGQWYPALASTGSGAVAVWVRQQEKGSVIGVARVR